MLHKVRAAHKYWQMTTDYSPYPAPFSDHKAVGILWSTKVYTDNVGHEGVSLS